MRGTSPGASHLTMPRNRPAIRSPQSAPSPPSSRPSVSVCRASRARLGAERHANGQFRPAIRRAHQQQGGHVHAGDDEHQARGGEEEEQHVTAIADQGVQQSLDDNRHRPVVVWKLRGQLTGDDLELGPGLLRRPVARQSAQDLELTEPAVVDVETPLAAVEEPGNRHPHLGAQRIVDFSRGDAHDDQRAIAAGPGQPAADESRIAARRPPPEPLADHRDNVRARPFVGSLKPASVERISAMEHGKKISRDRRQRHGRRATVNRQRARPAVGIVDRGHLLEAARLVPPRREFRVRDGMAIQASLGVVLPDADDAILILGNRSEQDRVDDGKERRDGADAEAEGEHGQTGELTAPPQAAGGIAKIVREYVQHLRYGHGAMWEDPRHPLRTRFYHG